MNKLLLVGTIMMLLVALPGCGNGDEEESAEEPAGLEMLDGDSAVQSEESGQTSTADEAEDTASEEAAQ